jgi:hypothetical protein
MDHRILIAVVVGLVVVACGGFYYALNLQSFAPAALPPHTAGTPPKAAAPAAKPDAPVSEAAAPVKTVEPARPTTPAKPTAPATSAPATAAAGKATAAGIEAEIARTDNAELQSLLRERFPDDYKELIEIAVRRRNEGVADEAFGRELFSQIQTIMRAKLKFAAGADIAIIDKLAANEIKLFQALANEGAPFCLTILGRENTPPQGVPPETVRRLLRLGTLYRFQAIADGMPNFRPIEALKPAEMVGFQAALVSNGMNFEDVRSGAFLNQEGEEPGKPCLMIERLYRTITGLGAEARRKLYSGMLFLGRDR